jgi:hypothetical protein
MHLPYYQLTNEVIDLAAPEIAIRLDAEDVAILGGLVKLIKWALNRCPDHLPPSASDIVEGSFAPKLVARAAGWKGDPDEFVDACAGATPSLLERVEGGIRIRGLDRYDAAWGKSHADEWKAWKDARRAESAPEPGRNRDESEPVPTLQTKNQKQIQKQTQIQKLPPPPPEVPPPPPAPTAEQSGGGGGDQDPVGQKPPSESELWETIQVDRERTGLQRESRKPKDWLTWFPTALERFGFLRIWEAYVAYRHDDDFRRKGWPTAIFVTPGVFEVRAMGPPDAPRASW